MSRKDQDSFKDCAQFFENRSLEGVDIVVIAVQECPRKDKMKRAAEIEEYMNSNLFINVSR